MSHENTPLITPGLNDEEPYSIGHGATRQLEPTVIVNQVIIEENEEDEGDEDEIFEDEDNDDVTSLYQNGQSQSISVSVSQSTRNTLWTSQHKFNASSTMPKLASYAQISDTHIAEIPEHDPPYRRRRLDSAGSVLTRGSFVSVLGEERTGDNLITWYQCMAHLLKSMIGTGLLALPFAFSLVGIVAGPLFMGCIACMALVAMNFLLDACRHMCKVEERPYMDYGELAESVLRHGPFEFLQSHCHIAKRVINTLLVMTQLGFCAVYFVFFAQTVDSVLTDFDIHNPFSDRVLICMFFVPVVMLCLIRNLALLAVFSSLANLLLAFGLGVIIYELLTNVEEPRELPAFKPFANLPLFFGAAVYTVEGIGVVLPLENKMQKPEHFKRVLNFGMIFVFMLCLTFGFLGYDKYGDDIEASISLNLPNNWYCSLTKILFAVAMYVSYALQFLVPVRILMPWVKEKFPNSNGTLRDYLFRLSLIAVTFLAAIIVPKLNLFIELLGSLASSSLAMTLPAIIFEFSLHSNKKISFGRKCLYRVFIVMLLVVGTCGCVVGSVLSMKNIILAFVTSDEHHDNLNVTNITTTSSQLLIPITNALF